MRQIEYFELKRRHLKFLAMATGKFSASEVLHMLADEELNAFSQREFEQESEDDDEVCGDYMENKW